MNEIKIDLLPNYYLKEDNTFDLDKALNTCGKIAGICYDKEGYDHLKNEDKEKTDRRIDRTINNGHHSVYDHIYINMNIKNIPKIVAMIINNEKQYTTSEKSFRYTKIVRSDDSIITKEEEELYNKWNNIFFELIKKEDKENRLSDIQIKKLAQENSRYLVTIFVPAQMVYTTSLRQINYLASWMNNYIENAKTDFELKVSESLKEFISELKRNNILDERLMKNEKNRSISLFGKDLTEKDDYFSDIYSCSYQASFACIAQAQRHRTLSYQIELNDKYYVPEILKDYKEYEEEWINDIKSVGTYYPMGQLVNVREKGTYENFILKCKERLCTAAQLEIMLSTKEILNKYKEYLKNNNDELYDDILKYSKGARCTFPCYKCSEDCKYKEGKLLNRKI